ncbi:MAG: PQQ-binding-like beta-propeller repeat protein [Acidobacteria bacterium]|nr:PQQ-binding-like beta-propeller repeat protein [Acidobacteriota bacterium]
MKKVIAMRFTNHSLVFLMSSFLLCVIGGRADAQWAQFRGPNGSGVDSSTGYPVEFSPTKNVAWKASIPFGQSSPVVVGTRVYGTASEGERLITFCLDTRTGRELWRREVKRERVQAAYKANDPASPTPAADGNGVVAFFPELGLISYDDSGKERWRYALGPFKNFYGMSSSPIIAGSLVVLVCDQVSGSFVMALDRATGRLRWKADRPGMTIGWATPIIFRPEATRTELIVLGSTRLDAYDLASGASRWWLPLASGGSMGTPLAHGDTLMLSTLGGSEPMLPTFAATLAKYDKDKDGRLSPEEFRDDPDFGEHFGWIDENDDKVIVSEEWDKARALGMGEWGAIAVRPGNARGRLGASAVRWRAQKNIPYIPAPLLYQDVYYMVKTGGIITSLDPATGRMLKQGRSPNALGEYYASPVAADGKVFLASTEGKITVLKAGAEWEVLSVNEIGDEIGATPALSDGRIYVRTRGAMYCFSASR